MISGPSLIIMILVLSNIDIIAFDLLIRRLWAYESIKVKIFSSIRIEILFLLIFFHLRSIVPQFFEIIIFFVLLFGILRVITAQRYAVKSSGGIASVNSEPAVSNTISRIYFL